MIKKIYDNVKITPEKLNKFIEKYNEMLKKYKQVIFINDEYKRLNTYYQARLISKSYLNKELKIILGLKDTNRKYRIRNIHLENEFRNYLNDLNLLGRKYRNKDYEKIIYKAIKINNIYIYIYNFYIEFKEIKDKKEKILDYRLYQNIQYVKYDRDNKVIKFEEGKLEDFFKLMREQEENIIELNKFDLELAKEDDLNDLLNDNEIVISNIRFTEEFTNNLELQLELIEADIEKKDDIKDRLRKSRSKNEISL